MTLEWMLIGAAFCWWLVNKPVWVAGAAFIAAALTGVWLLAGL
jgi:hypothetical protein